MEELELLDLFDASLDTMFSEGGSEVFLADVALAAAPEAYAGSEAHAWLDESAALCEDWDGDGVPDYADYWSGAEGYGPLPNIDGGGGIDEIDLQGLAAGEVPALLDAFDGTEDTALTDLLPGGFTQGNPWDDAAYWQQQEAPYSCAVAAQRGVLESIYQRQFSEHELAQVSLEQGWHDPVAGTPPDALGRLLEYHGVRVEDRFGTPWSAVLEAWDRGDEVIVPLDASEMWHPQAGPNGQLLEQPDLGHAVWVTGRHQDAKGEWHVVVNDPGRPDGRAMVVSLADFENAWEDFGRRSFITHKGLGTTNVT